ncbi:hypothetical protein ACVINW_005671 [Bradyrhizobium sp. USDA 4461]
MVEELSTLQALIQSEVPDIALLQSCFCLKHKGKQIQPDDLSALADEPRRASLGYSRLKGPGRLE